MLKTVASYTIAMEAYIAKGRLQAEGIPASIVNEHYIESPQKLKLHSNQSFQKNDNSNSE